MRSKATEVQQQGYNKTKNKLLTSILTVMKKMFLFAAFAGVALASCTTDEEIFAPINQGNEIEFVAANYVHQTRASEDPQEHDLTKPFTNENYSVWAWKTGTANAHMDDVTVTYDAEAKTNTVDATYYWPDEALDFAAVSPAADDRIQVKRDGASTTITYTFKDVDGYRNNQTNLMHADFVTASKQTVALGFRHALAKLNVVVKQTQAAEGGNPANGNGDDVKGYQVIVNNLSIENFNCYGTFTVTSNAQNKTDRVWEGTSGDADWTILDNTPTSLVTDITSFANEDFDATYGYVMPQALDNNVKVNIDYDVVTVFDSVATSTINKTHSVALNTIKNGSTAITNWYTNKNITYTFTINPKYELTPITFSATEEEWGTQGGAHTF